MRKETHPPRICVHCKLPIPKEQRPAIQLKNGDELHFECWEERRAAERRKQN